MKKTAIEVLMDFNEERAGLISGAIGMAVVNLIAFGVPINRDNLVEELERVRRETGNVIGKGLIEMLRRSLEKGCKKSGSVAGLCLSTVTQNRVPEHKSDDFDVAFVCLFVIVFTIDAAD